MVLLDHRFKKFWFAIVVLVVMLLYTATQEVSPLASLGHFFSAIRDRILETEFRVERDVTKLMIYSWTRLGKNEIIF